jgi:hypothetical protein
MKELFKESNGQVSSMRLIVFLIVATIIGTWSYTVINTGEWVALQIGDAVALIGTLGMKAYQKGNEK